MFNVITVDRQGVEAEKNFLKALNELSKAAGNYQGKGNKLLLELEEGIAKAFADETKKGLSSERDEYKIIMNIINSAAKRDKNIMDELRTSFQTMTNQTSFARWAMRAEINSDKRDIQVLNNAAERIRHYVAQVKKQSNGTKSTELLTKELQGHYEKTINAVRDFYKESYAIKKRDLMLIIKILMNVSFLKNQLEKWKEQHFLPAEPVNELIEFMESEVYGKLEEGMRPIAQGFRILVHDTEVAYKEALSTLKAS